MGHARAHAIAAALLAVALCVYELPAFAQSRVNIIGLGTLGGIGSQGFGINDSGQVTGYSFLPDGSFHAFLYSGSSMQDLGTLGGAESQGLAINASGQVAGNSTLPGETQTRAFLYSGGAMQNLGTLGGTSDSFAYGINAAGDVAGQAPLPGDLVFHAFIYSGGVMRDLGTLGGAFSSGRAINASGAVAGWSSMPSVPGAAPQIHAVRYSGGVMQDLGHLGGGQSEARAINASGEVTGYAETASGASRAFLYSGSSIQDLGTLGGASVGLGINDSGQVVGNFEASIGVFGQRAFLWNAGTMFDLNSVAPPGWMLVSADAINNNAQITGTAFNPASSNPDALAEAFVLTLHPDWQGGNGTWSDGAHWNYAGLGIMAVAPSALHEVVIHPAGSATVLGGADVAVRSLQIAGNPGHIVTLNLNGGSTVSALGTNLDANAVLAGSGRLVGDVSVQVGARINVGAGESMQLSGGRLVSEGTIRVLGTAANPASLEVGGVAINAGQINLQNANVSFLSGLTNFRDLNTTFGVANIFGAIDNRAGGKIIVSNGVQASFFDPVANNGELRVSAGGAANFFGLVSGAGLFTGTGQSRYEGGLSVGNSTALVTIEHQAAFGSDSPIIMELGGTTPGSGHDKIVFNNAVTLEGGDLSVLWYESWRGSASDVYDLFDWNGTLSGAFGNVNLPTLEGELFWSTSSLYTTGEISIMAIPEPGTYALLLAGLALLGFAARRRRQISEKGVWPL